MKLLLDQGLPRSASTLLSAKGIDTIHVGEIGLSSAQDREILEKAGENGYVVVTLDADFHTLLAFTEEVYPSVIRIRIEGLRAEALTNLLVNTITECEQDLIEGSAVIIEPHRIRLRRLPLLNSI
ncbi:UNVERIFIED_CONTAM: hypothetical protein BEN50_15810 [Euhalothece sp. KZN 001]